MVSTVSNQIVILGIHCSYMTVDTLLQYGDKAAQNNIPQPQVFKKHNRQITFYGKYCVLLDSVRPDDQATKYSITQNQMSKHQSASFPSMDNTLSC